jgi:hypothetical protein
MAFFHKLKTSRLNVNGRYTDMRGGVLPVSHGPGVIGTVFAPRKYQWTENGIIVTQLEVDITGLACRGDSANDVIGLSGGGAAYLDRVVTATHGVIFRAEMYCVETPGEGTATITDDIDITYDTLATLEYDGAGDGAAIASAGSWTAGRTIVNEDCATGFAANNYLYLGEGSTAATTGVFDAGQFIVKMYGHAVLT